MRVMLISPDGPLRIIQGQGGDAQQAIVVAAECVHRAIVRAGRAVAKIHVEMRREHHRLTDRREHELLLEAQEIEHLGALGGIERGRDEQDTPETKVDQRDAMMRPFHGNLPASKEIRERAGLIERLESDPN